MAEDSQDYTVTYSHQPLIAVRIRNGRPSVWFFDRTEDITVYFVAEMAIAFIIEDDAM